MDWLMDYLAYIEDGYSEEEICKIMKISKMKLKAKISVSKFELKQFIRPRIIFSLPSNYDIDKLQGA
jgi:hypothetical protein